MLAQQGSELPRATGSHHRPPPAILGAPERHVEPPQPPGGSAVTWAQAWLWLGSSPTSAPVMLYLWRSTEGVTPR